MFARPVRALTSVDLVAVLGGVRVDEDALGARAGRRLAEDPVRARDGEARAPGEAEPAPGRRRASARGGAPPRRAPRRWRRRAPGGFVERVVHQGVAARHPEAGRLRRAEDGVGVADGPHVEERGRPAGGELGEAEAGGELERLVVVRGLAGPDVRLEPREELEVVGTVPQERLAEVDVRLDEAGEEPEPLARRSARPPRRAPRRRPRRRAPAAPRARMTRRPRPRRRRRRE